jgi:L-asparagine transporter-like permease
VFLISTCCYLQCAQFSDCLRRRCDTFVMQKKKHFLVWLLQWLCNVKFAIQEDQLIDCCCCYAVKFAVVEYIAFYFILFCFLFHTIRRLASISEFLFIVIIIIVFVYPKNINCHLHEE